MSNETFITIRGRLAEDPQLRFTPPGAAVANLTIASNARKYDKQTQQWVDQTATFWRCSIWRDTAENVAESLQKGMAVIAVGEVKSREYEKDGEKRTVIEVELEAIGPDLRWQTAKVAKAQRGQGGFTAAPQQGAQAQDDPWATGSTSGWAADPAPF